MDQMEAGPGALETSGDDEAHDPTLVLTSDAVLAPSGGWAVEVRALKPETLATLIQIARDLHPHDGIADRSYALAAKSLDRKAESDAAHRERIESGVADLDHCAGGAYLKLDDDGQRVAALGAIEGTAFFRALCDDIEENLREQSGTWRRMGF